MEKKDGFVLFFAVLSALLVVCLGYHMWLLHCEVAELRGRVAVVEQLKSKVEVWEGKCDCSQSQTSPSQKPTPLPQTSTDGKHAVDKRETHEPTDIPTLLTLAFSWIVEGQLRKALECTEEDQELGRECTIQPGPKGEVGMTGKPGLKGKVGEKGVKGDTGPIGYPGHKGNQGDRGELGPVGLPGEGGEKGGRGQLGYPGYKGQMGEIGDRGEIGPVGPRGVQGIKGQKGEVALRQSGCTWLYTDRCGHLCGIKPFTAVCPTGQYVAGFGIHTYTSYGRYNTRVYCCTP